MRRSKYPSGSEWRKWDLHVHLPGTKLNDGYDKKEGKPDWDRFADILENSDVAVFGITDYFRIEKSLEFISFFKGRYPNSGKLLLVNLELRLNEAVSKDGQMINFHVIFRDDINEKIEKFLSTLKIAFKDNNGYAKTCAELASEKDYEGATVTRKNIEEAFNHTFGDTVDPVDKLIYLVSSGSDGNRADTKSPRKVFLSDDIDKLAHAVFGKNEETIKYYLKTDRYENKEEGSKPKPVFGGCDAHNFESLEKNLGKANSASNNHQVITWIKADPTFEGLQQTLVEPENRVSLSASRPDYKDSYKVIKKVTFENSKDFPEEIHFNPNLNTIIGSRSSGKSALLAYMAYTVDPEYTKKQQRLVKPELGPAAGHSWASEKAEGVLNKIHVEWASKSVENGKITYIPQNFLHLISRNPQEVTAKISEVLKIRYSDFFIEYDKITNSVSSLNRKIEDSVNCWFELVNKKQQLEQEAKGIGDKAAIKKNYDDLVIKIEQLQKENSLNEGESNKYQEVAFQIADGKKKITSYKSELKILDSLFKNKSEEFVVEPDSLEINISIDPKLQDLPEKLSETLQPVIEKRKNALYKEVSGSISSYYCSVNQKVKELESRIEKIKGDNKTLIEKYKANTVLNKLVERQKNEKDKLGQIENIGKQLVKTDRDIKTVESDIVAEINNRKQKFTDLREQFNSQERKSDTDKLIFGLEIDFSSEEREKLAEFFNRKVKSEYLDVSDSRAFKIEKAQEFPKEFISDIYSVKQQLKKNSDEEVVIKKILTAIPEVRFTAELDGDKIGGFESSTMTPGKQALFALILILNESEEEWPLFIDQPEDDLDSRSICEEIVEYLTEQKKCRQIILVTHNANIVAGADAEEVIVANRHGDDRKNKNSLTFDYLTGSLENSASNTKAKYDLGRMGIREHVIELLDGGKEAFQKRRDKYKI